MLVVREGTVRKWGQSAIIRDLRLCSAVPQNHTLYLRKTKRNENHRESKQNETKTTGSYCGWFHIRNETKNNSNAHLAKRNRNGRKRIQKRRFVLSVIFFGFECQPTLRRCCLLLPDPATGRRHREGSWKKTEVQRTKNWIVE